MSTSDLVPTFHLSPLQKALSRRTFMKGATLSTLVATTGLTLASCGSSGDPQSSNPLEGEITIWDRSGDLAQVFAATIPAFNKKYPKIKVNHVAVDIASKLPSTLATGVNVPDGAFYDDSALPTLAAQYYDITDWIQPYSKDIVPFKLRANTYNGRVVGIPWDLDPGLLFYREDLLQTAGIDPASIETYDDLIAASHKLQQHFGPQMKPIHLEQDPFLSLLWVEMFANQMGTSMVDANGKLQINSPEYLKIMNFLDQVRKENLGTLAAYQSPGDNAAVESDHIAFYPWAIWAVYGPDFLYKKSKGKWRAMALPAWKKGEARGAVMGGSSFIIPKKAKHPHLAWLYYEHLVFSAEGYQSVYGPNKIYPGGINTSMPSYLPALQKQLFQNTDGLGGQDLWDVAVGTVEDIPGNYTYARWYSQAPTYFTSNVQRMLNGQMTPEQVLQQSASDIQSKLIDRQ